MPSGLCEVRVELAHGTRTCRLYTLSGMATDFTITYQVRVLNLHARYLVYEVLPQQSE